MNEPKTTEPQPAPIPNDTPGVWDLVIADMQARDNFGRAKYGTPLQINNGRDALVDLYQELLDAVVYTRQLLEERKSQHAEIDMLRETLASVEREVALVYCDITDGAISKCNTDAATVIAVAHDCADKAWQAAQ